MVKVYMPDDDVRFVRYAVGDVFAIQHGPHIPNVYLWRVIAIDPIQTELVAISEYDKFREDFDRFVAREDARSLRRG